MHDNLMLMQKAWASTSSLRSISSGLLVCDAFRVTAPEIWNLPLHVDQSQTYTLLSDVAYALRRTAFIQPILPHSGPRNATWFSSET